MAKKKKKNQQKKYQDKAAKQFKKSSAHPEHPTTIIVSEKGLVVTGDLTKETDTTFSKKLEEVIAENEQSAKKGLFGRGIILLSAPIGYTKKQWKTHLHSLGVRVMKVLLAILVIAAICSAVVALELFSDQRILPNITLTGESLGYQKLDSAWEKTQRHLNSLSAAPITFTLGDQSFNLSPNDLEVSYLPEKTFDQLPKFYFPQTGVVNLIKAQFYPQSLSAEYLIDQKRVSGILEERFNLTGQRAKNARFALNKEKKLEVSAESTGKQIDQEALFSALNQDLKSGVNSAIEIKLIEEKPTITASDLQAAQPDLELKLENEIIINSANKKWKIKPMAYLDSLYFEKQNNQISIKVSSAMIPALQKNEIIDGLESPVGDLKITYPDQKVVFEGQAKNGKAIQKDKFVSELELAINSLSDEVEIQTEDVKSKIEIAPELQAMGIKELISTGHTAFAGSPVNRRHNVKTGMSKFNGVIIKPDETFSFNAQLGEVDGSTGYKLELVIKAEGTVPEFGGGVCQVSSTMFKAALLSGLPIVERAPHSYAVGYYAQVDGYGLDSTIYPGVRDLKFVNNTGSNILIQSFVDGDDAYFNFFGTSDGRQVKLENYWRGNYRGAGGTQLIPTKTLPTGAKKQIESAHGGFDASWDRVITKEGQEETREKIYSVYRATSNKILVGE